MEELHLIDIAILAILGALCVLIVILLVRRKKRAKTEGRSCGKECGSCGGECGPCGMDRAADTGSKNPEEQTDPGE